ncbi:MAG: hypothetical protein ACJ76H_06745 [Bacteriovoracaceae bacterium]
MKVISSLAVVVSLGLVTACNENIQKTSLDQNKKQVNTEKILASDLPSSQKAEQLALAAEQLLTPSGFIYADMILDQALKLDPANKRAGIYKAFLAAPMSAKGILARIKPLADKDLQTKKQLEDLIAKLPAGNYKNFLLDGKGDISNEQGVQAFADSVVNGLGKLREFAKANKNLEITLNVNDYLTKPEMYEYHASYCSTYPDSQGNYTTECNNDDFVSRNQAPSQFSMNRGDFEAVQHIAAGYQIYGSLLNSYSLSGAINVGKNASENPKPTSQIWKELVRDADFGKLRNDVFSKIPQLGSDAIIGVRWAMSLQNQLCPAGRAQSGSRPGMLVASGICINGDRNVIEDTLKMAELALSGGRISVRLGMNDTEVAPKALMDSPIQDLKELKPAFNKCGKLTSISNDSLNGLFPNHDVNDTLAQNSDCADDEDKDEAEE